MNNTLFDGKMVQSKRIIYTPTPFARANLLHLQEIGSLQARHPHESRRDNLASYLCFLVQSGAGQLDYQGCTYSLQAGDAVFLDCTKPYTHRTDTELWQLQWAHFYGPNLSAIYEKYQEQGGRPCWHSAQSARLSSLFEQLYATAGAEDYVRDMRLNELLSALLTLLMEESWQPEAAARPSTKRQNLQEIKEYLDGNFNKKITLDTLAERFFLNKFYLTRVFKAQFGVTINEYLTQVRITHAKRQLRFTDERIEAIAADCGLPDPNYFSRVFRKVEGISPKDYRARW